MHVTIMCTSLCYNGVRIILLYRRDNKVSPNLEGLDMSSIEFIDELTEQELNSEDNSFSGGVWTVPGTRTIGRVCTASWECWGFLCG